MCWEGGGGREMGEGGFWDVLGRGVGREGGRVGREWGGSCCE